MTDFLDVLPPGTQFLVGDSLWSFDRRFQMTLDGGVFKLRFFRIPGSTANVIDYLALNSGIGSVVLEVYESQPGGLSRGGLSMYDTNGVLISSIKSDEPHPSAWNYAGVFLQTDGNLTIKIDPPGNPRRDDWALSDDDDGFPQAWALVRDNLPNCVAPNTVCVTIPPGTLILDGSSSEFTIENGRGTNIGVRDGTQYANLDPNGSVPVTTIPGTVDIEDYDFTAPPGAGSGDASQTSAIQDGNVTVIQDQSHSEYVVRKRKHC